MRYYYKSHAVTLGHISEKSFESCHGRGLVALIGIAIMRIIMTVLKIVTMFFAVDAVVGFIFLVWV